MDPQRPLIVHKGVVGHYGAPITLDQAKKVMVVWSVASDTNHFQISQRWGNAMP
jgi:hypothetical protein